MFISYYEFNIIIDFKIKKYYIYQDTNLLLILKLKNNIYIKIQIYNVMLAYGHNFRVENVENCKKLCHYGFKILFYTSNSCIFKGYKPN